MSLVQPKTESTQVFPYFLTAQKSTRKRASRHRGDVSIFLPISAFRISNFEFPSQFLPRRPSGFEHHASSRRGRLTASRVSTAGLHDHLVIVDEGAARTGHHTAIRR